LHVNWDVLVCAQFSSNLAKIMYAFSRSYFDFLDKVVSYQWVCPNCALAALSLILTAIKRFDAFEERIQMCSLPAFSPLVFSRLAIPRDDKCNLRITRTLSIDHRANYRRHHERRKNINYFKVTGHRFAGTSIWNMCRYMVCGFGAKICYLVPVSLNYCKCKIQRRYTASV